MDEQLRDVDDALERVLAWRATRSASIGLVGDIRKAVGSVPQRRGVLMWRTQVTVLRLVVVGALLLVAAAVVIGLGSGAPKDLKLSAQASASASGPTLFDCPSRALAASANLDLTGTWFDRANLYYLHQVGPTVWGVAINSPEATYPDLTQVGPYLIFNGTISADQMIHVSWASAGDRFPGEHRFAPYDDRAGGLTWKVTTGNDGNVELVTTSETGDALNGPAYGLPSLVACTPIVH